MLQRNKLPESLLRKRLPESLPSKRLQGLLPNKKLCAWQKKPDAIRNLRRIVELKQRGRLLLNGLENSERQKKELRQLRDSKKLKDKQKFKDRFSG